MFVFLIVMFCITSYAFVGGAFYAQFLRWRKRVCPRCGRKKEFSVSGGHYFDSCNRDHEFSAATAASFWPVILPAVAGFMVGDRDKSKRLQTQRQRELEQAKHDGEIARQKRIEAEEVVRQLKAIDKTDALKGLLG